MKFIHCSDLHLDSKMEQHLSAAQARERNAECCATFARLVRYAAEQDVTAVLIAGDMFDTERASAQTAGFVLDQIRNTPGVDFLYLRGNHDEAVFNGLELPGNFKRLWLWLWLWLRQRKEETIWQESIEAIGKVILHKHGR